MEDSGKSREHGVSLLLHRRQIAADAAKSRGPSRTAKGASNLLLHFDHPQVALSLIVRKWNREVVEQRQHLFGTLKQCILVLIRKDGEGKLEGEDFQRKD